MTTTVTTKLNNTLTSTSKRSTFTSSLQNFSANAISKSAQQQLKGGDGEDGDILIEEMIGG